MRKELGLGLLLVVAACAPLYLPAYELSLLGRFLALAVLALGISLIWGTGGILSLGQGVFFALGGYAIAMHLKLAGARSRQLARLHAVERAHTLPWWWAPFQHPAVAIAAVFVLPALAAAILAYLVFRRRVTGAYFAIITQALALAATTFIISQQQFTGGFNGLTGFTSAFGFTLGDSQHATRAVLDHARRARARLRGRARAANVRCSESACSRCATARTACGFSATTRCRSR
jgi:urea transport system permease protein